ncbi:hypothetical protein MUN78_16380 [Leucobacter allii]|uniref:Uncharacterized protein n=1 Tax=Leucobacter allii TaxID=2932247 RepID=A0ABY4FLQ0_9MICO|nr:hypothetical protein [Leucobacter allii]UOQ57207.1 hypothetical protein MUN78_16380 [Leucobacter allii]
MATEIGSAFMDVPASDSHLRTEALNHAVKLRMSTNVRGTIGEIVADADEMYRFLKGDRPVGVSLPGEVAQSLNLVGGVREVRFARGAVARWTHDPDGLRVELNEEPPAF